MLGMWPAALEALGDIGVVEASRRTDGWAHIGAGGSTRLWTPAGRTLLTVPGGADLRLVSRPALLAALARDVDITFNTQVLDPEQISRRRPGGGRGRHLQPHQAADLRWPVCGPAARGRCLAGNGAGSRSRTWRDLGSRGTVWHHPGRPSRDELVRQRPLRPDIFWTPPSAPAEVFRFLAPQCAGRTGQDRRGRDFASRTFRNAEAALLRQRKDGPGRRRRPRHGALPWPWRLRGHRGRGNTWTVRGAGILCGGRPCRVRQSTQEANPAAGAFLAPHGPIRHAPRRCGTAQRRDGRRRLRRPGHQAHATETYSGHSEAPAPRTRRGRFDSRDLCRPRAADGLGLSHESVQGIGQGACPDLCVLVHHVFLGGVGDAARVPDKDHRRGKEGREDAGVMARAGVQDGCLGQGQLEFLLQALIEVDGAAQRLFPELNPAALLRPR